MICERLHKIFNGIKRHRFPFDERCIPRNGIYVLFEQGERAHGCDRIVRVGTHTGHDNLPQRLAEHFTNENKNRSIFRKNVGRALLNRRQDPMLKQWEIDLTTSAAKLQMSGGIDLAAISQVEKEVSAVIRNSFTFSVVRVDDRQYRLTLEKRLIATISHCSGCRASETWLGNCSPKSAIGKSGLWLVQGLNGCGMDTEDLCMLEESTE